MICSSCGQPADGIGAELSKDHVCTSRDVLFAYFDSHPTLFTIAVMLAEQNWTENELVLLIQILRRCGKVGSKSITATVHRPPRERVPSVQTAFNASPEALCRKPSAWCSRSPMDGHGSLGECNTLGREGGVGNAPSRWCGRPFEHEGDCDKALKNRFQGLRFQGVT